MEYDKFVNSVSRNVDSLANSRYNRHYSEVFREFSAIIVKRYKNDNEQANKLIDQCLAVCGHSGYTLDYSFLRCQHEDVLSYINGFVTSKYWE